MYGELCEEVDLVHITNDPLQTSNQFGDFHKLKYYWITESHPKSVFALCVYNSKR